MKKRYTDLRIFYLLYSYKNGLDSTQIKSKSNHTLISASVKD